jgi:endogenous inhibitor of DNA gyrase (YacG/DUF329 family)
MPKIKVKVACIVCNTIVERYKHLLRPRIFCSNACKGLSYKESLKGENNPNLGNKWTEEQKIAGSLRTSSHMTKERRDAIGDFHRGKVMSAESRAKMSKANIGRKGTPHSDDMKAIIGKASAAKFTDSYKKEYRLKMEASGYWIPLIDQDEYKLYFKLANWISKMFDLVTDKEQLEKLPKLGVFNKDTNSKGVVRDHSYSRWDGFKVGVFPEILPKLGVFNKDTNSKGVVRDHSYSRWDGFKVGVFPEILRHPANRTIMSHSDNIRKIFSKSSNKTLEELFHDIKYYQNSWEEHDICLKLISRYMKGERYNKLDYISKY